MPPFDCEIQQEAAVLSLAEFYLMCGEEVSDNNLEKRFAQTQIYVGEDAVRNYTRRYIDPMMWEDRFQRPNRVHLYETPVTEIVAVMVDGLLIDPLDYYFYHATGRLYSRAHGTPGGWPWGWGSWVGGDATPDTLPEYYGNWRGVGAMSIVYKSGYDPCPMIIKQVVADYAYERVLVQRALANSGGSSPIPAGTVTQVTIEGVGSLRYSDGASTTANSSRRAQTSGEPVIGAAGPILDAYAEVAVVMPGLSGLISHKKIVVTPPVTGQPAIAFSNDPTDVMIYSDLEGDLVLFEDAAATSTLGVGSSVLVASTDNPRFRRLWDNVYWPIPVWVGRL